MMRSPLVRICCAFAAAIAMAACFGDPAGPTEFPSGSMRFSYVRIDTGGVPLADSVAFAAEGPVTLDSYFSGTYAFGLLSTTFTDSQAVRVYGQQAQETEGVYDGMLLFIASPAVGTVTCAVTSSPLTCPFAATFRVGASEDVLASDPTILVTARSGSVTITSVDDGRVKGTFRLQMRGTVDGQADALVRVSGGSFDVPLTSSDSLTVGG
ncbi:hypothetical protein [Longimicrobium terrae]|nr:hypothetical protein [Longimicrobium terrae]